MELVTTAIEAHCEQEQLASEFKATKKKPKEFLKAVEFPKLIEQHVHFSFWLKKNEPSRFLHVSRECRVRVFVMNIFQMLLWILGFVSAFLKCFSDLPKAKGHDLNWRID